MTFWILALLALFGRGWIYGKCIPLNDNCRATILETELIAIATGIVGSVGIVLVRVGRPKGGPPWTCSACGELFYEPTSDAINKLSLPMGSQGLGVGLVAAFDAGSGRRRCPVCGSDRFRGATTQEIAAVRASGRRIHGEMPWQRKAK